MKLEISKEQAARLDVIRREFNAFTGKKMNQEQFAAYLLSEAIDLEEKTARRVQTLGALGRDTLRGARLVH